MASNITTLTDIILEKTTPKFTAIVQDEDGAAIPSANLDTLTLTMFNLNDLTYPIINSRDNQDVKNINNVTVDGSGNVVWQLQEEDTAIIDALLSVENRRAVFAWTYDGGAKTGRYIIDMTIKNLKKVT